MINFEETGSQGPFEAEIRRIDRPDGKSFAWLQVKGVQKNVFVSADDLDKLGLAVGSTGQMTVNVAEAKAGMTAYLAAWNGIEVGKRKSGGKSYGGGGGGGKTYTPRYQDTEAGFERMMAVQQRELALEKGVELAIQKGAPAEWKQITEEVLQWLKSS